MSVCETPYDFCQEYLYEQLSGDALKFFSACYDQGHRAGYREGLEECLVLIKEYFAAVQKYAECKTTTFPQKSLDELIRAKLTTTQTLQGEEKEGE